MEWSHMYNETPMVAVGSSYGRRVLAIDAAEAQKQRSVVA